ncbi:MAG: DUF1846 domain-containing protein, partial [Syntrophaceae bacterium]|nr:DUF1846 domain-containing protein [Syntrophaceae bacterium]
MVTPPLRFFTQAYRKDTVNVAYEAATADIRDFNLIDPFHLEAYDEKAVNYNRDVEVFPV